MVDDDDACACARAQSIAGARLVPVAEECLGKYIPQLFPIIFLDEAVDAGQVCGPSTNPNSGDQKVCTTKANTCTNAPCTCPGSQRKVVHTYGTPVQTCWSCEASPSGDNYDDDDDDDEGVDAVERRSRSRGSSSSAEAMAAALPHAPWEPGKLFLAKAAAEAIMHRHRQNATLNATHAMLPLPAAAAMLEVAVDHAFLPWEVLKYAGWSEPVNKQRSSTEFYRRLYQSIPGAPHSMELLLEYHSVHRTKGA